MRVSGIAGRLAGLIIEPLVQGAGGMRFHSPECWPHSPTSRRNMIFFSSPMRLPPDSSGPAIRSLARERVSGLTYCVLARLTGGTLGLGATLTSEEIFDSFLSDDHDFGSCTDRRSWPTRLPVPPRMPRSTFSRASRGPGKWHGLKGR